MQQTAVVTAQNPANKGMNLILPRIPEQDRMCTYQDYIHVNKLTLRSTDKCTRIPMKEVN